MTKTYLMDDRKSSKAIFLRQLKYSIEREVNDTLDDLVDEDYEAVSLFGHIFLPSELLTVDSDVKDYVYQAYVDMKLKEALKTLDEGLVVTFSGVDFKIKKEEEIDDIKSVFDIFNSNKGEDKL